MSAPEVRVVLVDAFQRAWEAADAEGRTGHRTEAGIDAVLEALRPCVPSERTTADGVTVDCACGERGVLWSHPVGARSAYLQHVAERAAGEWGGSVDVDYREDES